MLTLQPDQASWSVAGTATNIGSGCASAIRGVTDIRGPDDRTLTARSWSLPESVEVAPGGLDPIPWTV